MKRIENAQEEQKTIVKTAVGKNGVVNFQTMQKREFTIALPHVLKLFLAADNVQPCVITHKFWLIANDTVGAKSLQN